MESTEYGIPMEDRLLLLGDKATSQKMDLKWTSVWRAKRMEIQWKTHDFCWGTGRNRRTWI
eukprot:2476265-Karenia_brevis.AAC.1